VAFAGGAAGIDTDARGEGMRVGEIDPRAVAATNEAPKLTAEQTTARTWTPDAGVWETIKKRSVALAASLSRPGQHPHLPGPGRRANFLP